MAYSSEGNHVLAILKVPESYKSLSNALKDIRREVCELKEIEVDGNTYEIIYFLGVIGNFLLWQLESTLQVANIRVFGANAQ